jgi:hypothetical protein
MSEDKTIPPVIQRVGTGIQKVWEWGQVHTVAATAIGAFVAGFIVGKL